MTSNEIGMNMPADDSHWELYVTYVDDNPAVLMVDIGIAELAPISEKPFLVWLRVDVINPDEERFPTEEEDIRLNEIEDAATESFAEADVRYVGRITSDGVREFYFYTADPEQFRDSVTTVMSEFPEYTFEADFAEDPEWTHYRDVLYPSPEDLQQIENQHIINRLYQAGDSLTTPRRIDHYANFKTSEDRESFISAAEALGYEAASRPDRPDTTEFPYAVGLLRVDPVDGETIDRITFELFDLAREHGGEYEGWGSEVITE